MVTVLQPYKKAEMAPILLASAVLLQVLDNGYQRSITIFFKSSGLHTPAWDPLLLE